MSTDRPDPRIRAALRLVDSPFLDRDEAALDDGDRRALGLIARIMGEFHALAPPVPSRGEPAFRWGSLEVHEEIGRGSFGVVYLARDPRLDLDVALKLQPLDDGDAHAILAEARRLARVRHVNVCTVLGADLHDGQVGLWTDHVPGRTLTRRLEGGPFTVPETIRVGVQLARALGAVHAAGLVHGDLSANNVIETPDGRIVLTDFGSSIVSSHPSDAAPPRTGTPLAMAPELFSSGSLSRATDIYALGALLFRLLTGEHLVRGETLDEIGQAHHTGARRSLVAYRDDVPAPLNELIARASAADPDARYSSASAMLDALATSNVPPHNLPAPSSSFVGRDRDLSVTRNSLREGRLVTLTGIGGVGKTRLATEVARAESHAHPDGVWLVELDEITEPDGVPPAAARACGLYDPARATSETFALALASRRVLLVLDNCEHVAPAVTELVTTLLQRAPSVTVLATSRAALGVPGEAVVSVAPLSVDPDAPAPTGAVRLFLDRLPAGSAPSVGDEWTDTVAKICRHVDGIPLALELAAARAPSLGLADLERRLAKHLGVIESRGDSRPERHRTMTALVAWSADLLSGECAAALTVLGTFPGSFTLEAAEEILATAVPSISDPLSALLRLVEDSLVERLESHDDRAATRYRLLVPVREYTATALDRHPDAPGIRDAFHDWYARLAIDVSKGERPDGRPLELIHADYHNVRRSLEAYLSDPRRRVSARALAIALFDYWYERGSRRDARRALERLFADDETEEATPELARLRYLSGVMTWTTGAFERALHDFDCARSQYRKLGMSLEESKARNAVAAALGKVAARDRNQDGLDEALALLEEGVRDYQVAGETLHEAEAYNNLGIFFMGARSLDRARAHFERALPLLGGDGSHRVLSAVHGNLARLDELAGDESAACAHLRAARDAARESSDLRSEAYFTGRLGERFSKMGEPTPAVEELENAIKLARRVGDERTVAYSRLCLARCCALRGDLVSALEHVLACIRFVSAHRFRGRNEMICAVVREASLLASLHEAWTDAAWMLTWSEECAERLDRVPGPRERETLAHLADQVSAALGPEWRDVARRGPAIPEEDALARARAALRSLDGVVER